MIRLKPLLGVLPLSLALLAAAQSNKGNASAATDKSAATTADSGSFTILVGGRQVATETFRMEQHGAENLISSDLKFDDGTTKVTQSAEMKVGSNGDLKRYVWKETSPSKLEVTVEPQDEAFLVAHVTDEKGTKDNLHPLTPFTSILDTDFFSHVELLLWKFVTMACQSTSTGVSECNFNEKRLPILNPRAQQSGLVGIEYIGRQKMRWNGKDSEFTAFKIVSEGTNYTVWLDNRTRLIRVLIPDERTEVIRN